MSSETRLWPYGVLAALLTAPAVWIVLGLAWFVARHNLHWQGQIPPTIAILPFAAALLPVLLVLLDYLATSRGILDIKGIKVDFSKAEIATFAFMLPDNIGIPGAIVTDSSPMQIVDTLETATSNPIVHLDIRAGNAWWVTRLMALCAGATRAGSPDAIVFVGVKENVDGTFLGWARPAALLKALTEDSQPRGPWAVTYGTVYCKAVSLAAQIAAFGRPSIPPAVYPPPAPAPPPDPAPPPLPTDVQRYLYQPTYVALGNAAQEQILMDLFSVYRLEDPPDRLTLGRLEHLFGHCLYREAVDLDQVKEDRAEAYLRMTGPYFALIRDKHFEGLVERSTVDRLVIQQIFERFGAKKRPAQ